MNSFAVSAILVGLVLATGSSVHAQSNLGGERALLGPKDVFRPNPSPMRDEMSLRRKATPAAKGDLMIPLPVSRSAGLQTSANWSGYVQSAGTYTSAQGAWSVPTAKYVTTTSGNPEQFATWVGIGGALNNDNTLIQVGTSAQSNGVADTPSYAAWYELAPDLQIRATGCRPAGHSACPVSPGDVITASLSCLAKPCLPSKSQWWALSMTNLSKGWTWSKTVKYKSSLASVEWVAEAPTPTSTFGKSAYTLMDYNSASFGGLLANGNSPQLLRSNGIVMIDPNGGTSTPCPPHDGDKFIVVYGKSNNCPEEAKLVGAGAVGQAVEGTTAALSADGNTAIVGGGGDNSGVGAAWIFTRTGSVWKQKGSKLVGAGAVGTANQGNVALSADGKTAIVGGPADNSSVGAAWIFERHGGVWTQQGPKLVGTGAVGQACQGAAVALSADGDTAAVGGYCDNSSLGAVWIFTRSGGVWTQQGSKLVGTGASGIAYQGFSVALSAVGNTVFVGGPADNSDAGAVWIFTRTGSNWAQQGSKLVGTGAVGAANQGYSVALSADGDTAISSGYLDNASTGAAWIFTRSGGVWTQQGPKLVGAGARAPALQGISVGLSAVGDTAILGGPSDSASGAAWIFARSGGVWLQQGSKVIGTGVIRFGGQGFSVALSAAGNTAMVGGPYDNSFTGAAWIFSGR